MVLLIRARDQGTTVQMKGCGGFTPPLILTPGPNRNLKGISRSHPGSASIESLFITRKTSGNTFCAKFTYSISFPAE